MLSAYSIDLFSPRTWFFSFLIEENSKGIEVFLLGPKKSISYDISSAIVSENEYTLSLDFKKAKESKKIKLNQFQASQASHFAPFIHSFQRR